MRIAIVGAGAVGGYYGARLAAAGNEVIFLARGANLAALRERGISVRSELGDIRAKVRAEGDPGTVGPAELVVLAVKTYSNREALPLLPPLVGPETAVLTLQNGVDSADEVAAVVGPGAVLGGATYIAAAMPEPAVVEHSGFIRRIVFGEAFGERTRTPRVIRVEETLGAAGIQAEGVTDWRVPVWEKFIFLAPLAAVTGAARLPLGPVWAQPICRETIGRAMAEVESIARATGVDVAPDVVEQKLRYLAASRPTLRSSLMMDIVAGRPIEVEALMGAAVRRGLALGIPTPVMAALYAVLKPYEWGEPPLGR